MAKDDIIGLINLLTNEQPRPNEVDEALDIVLKDFAKYPVRCKAHIADLQAGQETFDLPGETMMLMEAIYDGFHLDVLKVRELDATAGPDWRSHNGPCVAITHDQQNERTFRLYPVPVESTVLTVGPTFFWELIGSQFRTGSLLLFLNEYRNLPPSLMAWLDLYLALRVIQILHTRYAREQDLELASFCGKLARAMEPGLGIF